MTNREKDDKDQGRNTDKAVIVPKVWVSAVAMIDVDNRILLTERPGGKFLEGFWEFPGGKMFPHETPEQALIRELKEELDVDVVDSCLAPFTFTSYPYEAFHLVMLVYVCRIWEGNVYPVEGQKIRWVQIGEMADILMPPADKPVVALLRDWL